MRQRILRASTPVQAALENGWGGQLFTGERGCGKSLLLERCVDELRASDAAASLLIARVVPAPAGTAVDGEAVAALTRTVLLQRGIRSTGAGIDAQRVRGFGDPESIAIAVAEFLRAAAPECVIVVVADDLELLDGLSRRALLALAVSPGSRVVLLATACDEQSVRPVPHPVVVTPVHALDEAETLRLLHAEEGLAVAPHVAATLSRALTGNVAGILQTAAALSAEQLAGIVALPDPLPVTEATAAIFGAALDALDATERRALLIASVAVSRRTETLLAASGLTLARLIDGPLSRCLQFVAGSVDIVDPRVRALSHGTATLAERTEAHDLLAAAHDSFGEPGLAAWHTSLAALAGKPGIAPALISLARAALKRGDSSWAHDVAREAASQAVGPHRLTAEFTAGLAALQSGFTTDAVHWLGRVLRAGAPGLSARALAAYTIAVTLSSGHVPETEIEFVAARLAESDRSTDAEVLGVIGAMAAAAGLHAERGDAASAARMLARGHALCARHNEGRELVGLAAAWCAVFGVGTVDEAALPPFVSPASSWLHGYLAVCAGLALVVRGEHERAARMLSGTILSLTRAREGGIEGAPDVAASPLLDAHLRVAQAIVDVAAGEYSAAARALETAAFLGPVALVFAGLGVSCATRLDVLAHGAIGPIASSLRDLLPVPLSPAVRRGALVDQSFLASFAGQAAEAAAFMGMASDMTSRGIEQVLPVPDETRLWLDAGQRERAERTPQRAGDAAAALRTSLALTPAAHAREGWASAVDASRGIPNPYDRALTELEIGTAMAAAGEHHRARPHLLAAVELLFHTGASALTAHVRAASSTHGDPAQPSDWAADLTDREREVAALVVLGTSNREVATRLHLSVRTVEVHLARVFAKLDVHSRTELSYLVHGRGTTPLRSTT